jgi:hypothetical protein
VTGGHCVTRGVGRGFTIVGFEAAGGWLLVDRAPAPNILFKELERPSCPRSVYGRGLGALG